MQTTWWILTYAEGCANLSGNVEELEAHVDEGLAIEQFAQRSPLVQWLGVNCCNCRGRGGGWCGRGRGSAAFGKADHQREQQEIEVGAGAAEQLFGASFVAEIRGDSCGFAG